MPGCEVQEAIDASTQVLASKQPLFTTIFPPGVRIVLLLYLSHERRRKVRRYNCSILLARPLTLPLRNGRDKPQLKIALLRR